MVDLIGFSVAVLVFLTTCWWYYKKILQQQEEEINRKAVTPVAVAEEKHRETQRNEIKNVSKKISKKLKPGTGGKSSKRHERFNQRFGGHTGTIKSMSVSPDGEWMATAGTDGQIRVSKIHNTDNNHLFLRTNVKTPNMGVFQDHVSALSWLPDGRTIVCAICRSRDIAFYRIRKKKEKPDNNSSFPYELVELVKRRFSTNFDEGIEIETCIADLSNSCSSLVLTNTGATEHHNTVAWDGVKCKAMGRLTTCGGGIRLSPDGRFLCGRGLRDPPLATEVKIYEVHRSKVKGQSEPVFDKLSSKSVMTVIPRSARVADVAFCGTRGDTTSQSCLLCLCCDDGSVQIWDLDVEYKQREDPKLLCSATSVLPIENTRNTNNILCVAASFVGGVQRIAVVTSDLSLHLLIYSPLTPNMEASISLEFSIPRIHPEGASDLQFCPATGDVLYSKGAFSRDVFVWNVK